jgi:serine/threonine-protein kinase ULK2
VKLSEEYS